MTLSFTSHHTATKTTSPLQGRAPRDIRARASMSLAHP
ncbi:Hypothetical protein A7982_10187 [Minicystis rosea]|nr:Hypothetical protein A7982_10187 [Minicystis rosea]